MKCEKCKNELIEFRNGDDLEYICPICDETPVTQIDNLIEYDSNMYTVSILSTQDFDVDLVKKVAKVCACNYLEAKQILIQTGKIFKQTDAIETLELKEKLDNEGIPYSIVPKFNWR